MHIDFIVFKTSSWFMIEDISLSSGDAYVRLLWVH